MTERKEGRKDRKDGWKEERTDGRMDASIGQIGRIGRKEEGSKKG